MKRYFTGQRDTPPARGWHRVPPAYIPPGVFKRQIRESHLTNAQATRIRTLFLSDVQDGVWSLLPLSERFLFRVDSLVAALPSSSYLRAGDAIHLAAAQGAGFSEIWSNDRRLLEAAPGFGLAGKSV